MKTRTLLVPALVLALGALPACNRDRDGVNDMEGRPQTDVTPPNADAPAANTGSAPAPTMDQGQAAAADPQGESLGLVQAVDEHEIAAAEQARTKNPSQPVLEYANMLHGEHSKHLQAGRDLARQISVDPATTPAVAAQRDKGQAELRRLADLNGKAYEDAYVDAMVKGHTEALAMLDAKLPTVTDDRLKQFLTETRAAIAKHLDHGKQLQGSRR
ncbi:DUF4142 domain-containing protein [Vulcaniibacterium tengchongense]|uniref:Putative membrane protein n=1 Tax=Vulcaniibacterium tengchongense TaxID=1273429 RepID=A0A3N4VV13_9GAMM|nr:DUF4142 domain-containing protein [Vulcaniibacterium tengchongense]RPE76914.1 putative membrane protein [Vulcaniibacterium tengchongense]